MSKVLAQLLDKTEQDVKSAVAELEKICGYPSEDVRLIADNGLKLRQKMAQLGLDPDDTTNEELYRALLARFGNDAKQLDQAIGVDTDISLDRKMDLAIDLTKHLLAGQEVWALKPTAAKQLLLALPLKKLMKLLNYRSIDSLLKREAVSEIYLAASIIESSTWNRLLAKSAGSLSTANWTRQPLNLVKLSTGRFGTMTGPTSLTTSSQLTGAAALWPAPKLEKACVVNLSLLLAEATEALGIRCDPRNIANLNPVLHWWSNNEHLLAQHGGEPISLNLKDIATSYLKAVDYKNRSMRSGRESLWNEILRRYQAYTSADAEILSKLSGELSPEPDVLRDAVLPAKLAEQYAEA